MVALPQAHDDTMGAMIDAPAAVVSLRPSPDVKQYPTAPILSRENTPALTKMFMQESSRMSYKNAFGRTDKKRSRDNKSIQ
jgi:hypothetical protein